MGGLTGPAPGMDSASSPPAQSVQAEVGHIGAIEGLRGVAVVAVVLFHYLTVRPQGDPWNELVSLSRPLEIVIGNGYLGVDLFFLITGFLLVLPWLRHASEGREAPAIRGYYLRRARRILPAYYVHLAVLFACVAPFIHDTIYWVDRKYWNLNLLAHLLFLHYTTPFTSASMGLNGALWTLAIEFQYYLLLPLIAVAFVRKPRLAFAGLFFAAVAWHWLAANDLASLVAAESSIGAKWNIPEASIRHLLATQLPGYLAHFALGIFLGRAWLANRTRLHSEPFNAAMLACGLLGLFAIYAVYSGLVGVEDSFRWLVSPIGFGVAMYCFVSQPNPLAGTVLNQPALRFVGRISYSMYLYHLPLILVLNKILPIPDLSSFPIYVASLTLVAWLSYRYVELPFLSR